MRADDFRIGYGYDVHRLAAGETLVLGGVALPASRGTVAHSDGDVLLHALCDALLGALALGDIGEHFPDTDAAWRGAASTDLLQSCLRMCAARGWQVVNVDATLILERPKILPYKTAMRETIARVLGVDADRVSLKATTGEGIGFTGREEGAAAHAVVLLGRKE
ncbi:MAG: 2-C-methyl-D-erythritol 2,4-cyclodiphosphate synthase [Bacteroidota bacterium]|nr:2-C-methyl-D-erythritol 2,4-cyclodiphosphate synthase [Bacteroidota bacterium]